MGLPMDKVNDYVVCRNIRIYSNASFVFNEFFTIYTQYTTNLPPNLNKDFIEPPCRCDLLFLIFC